MNIFNELVKNIAHVGDILAIPFFLLSFYYFYAIENRNMLENVLLLFSFGGFIADIIFTYQYLSSNYNFGASFFTKK
jgi:hypothetical protein